MQSNAMFADRLREMIGGESVTAYAKRAGLSEGTLRNLLKGGDPKLSNAIAVAKVGGRSLGWLVGETNDDKVAEDAPDFGGGLLSDFDTVNLYEVNASAGHGAEVLTEKFKLLYFRKEWFSTRGLNANHLIAVNVVGDSMEPEIPNESVVLVDKTQREIQNGAIYVFTLNNDLHIKRMIGTQKGYKTKSFNTLYDDSDMEFDRDQLNLLKIVGRAVRALPDIKL